MKWIVGVVLLAGCVADVPGQNQPPPNPVPPSTGGGSAQQDTETQTEVTATAYLSRIATIHCQQAFNCRATYPADSATFEATWTGSVSECIAMLHDAWGVSTIESEIAKGRINYDGTAAVDCLAGVAFGSCVEQWTDGIQWAESCYHVMTGNVEAGASCDSLYACESYSCDVYEHVCL